jgi:DNA-3-methyladenine glycosylase I
MTPGSLDPGVRLPLSSAPVTPDPSRARCDWASGDPLMTAYHDTEWGVPMRHPHRLFELLCLEGAQAGLAWITILRKRDGYRAAFEGFDAQRMAAYTDADRERLLSDARIVRNRAKVDAFIGNARAFLATPDFAGLVWSVVDGRTLTNRWTRTDQVPAHTPASGELSRRLRERGFRFVGPTICYAFMQSAGLVDDHLLTCFRHGLAEPGPADPS